MMRTIEELREHMIEHHRNRANMPFTMDFGELLCYHIHQLRMTFKKLAEHFGITLDELAEVIADHIRKL